MMDQPYFMSQKNWFYYDFDEMRFKLTEEATEEAKKSYKEYIETLEKK